MTRKLAVVISGAVSLGSYEAGVMYEVIEALRQHNLGAGDEDRIVIDVLTGASAGGMTATICAQKLLYDAEALLHPTANHLYMPWVHDADISELLQTRPGDHPTQSVLSSQFIVELSKRYLTARYDAPLRQVRHPASAETIHLGLALSNLNGVDYSRAVLGSAPFVYTRFQDELTTQVGRDDDSPAFWERLRTAAVSCGAFPVAFRPVEVMRHRSEYQGSLVTPIGDDIGFCYTDGGVFQNEPLGMAKDLVDRVDPTHTDTANRTYLFISPDARNSTASAFTAARADYLALIKQLGSAIFNQARFHDWITAEKVNARVEKLNVMALELVAKAADSTRWGPMLAAAATVLQCQFHEDPASADPRTAINRARLRLGQQYSDELAPLPGMGRAAVVDVLLTLEQAGDLGDRDEMRIIGITADHTELAGADLSAFTGFFDRSYRQHDYDVGRAKARRVLCDPQGPLGMLRYAPSPLPPIDHRLDGMTLARTPRSVRDLICRRLCERMWSILKAEDLNWLERQIALRGFIKPKLKRFLKL